MRGGRLLVEPAQARLGDGVVRIDRQHVLQADAPIWERLDDPAEPQPRLLVSLLQFGDPQQGLARLLGPSLLGGGDSRPQQFGYLEGLGRVHCIDYTRLARRRKW